MKALLLIFSILFTTNALADCWPNIDGDYLSSAERPLRFRNVGCTDLYVYSGAKLVGGYWVFPVVRKFELGGAPVCTGPDHCTYANVKDGKVVFSYNFEARRFTSRHGNCIEKSATVQKEANGNLIYKAQLESCEDGFSGEESVTYVPTKF